MNIKNRDFMKFVFSILGFIFISINAQAVELLQNGKVIILDSISEEIRNFKTLNLKRDTKGVYR